jgi:hypothetical protein
LLRVTRPKQEAQPVLYGASDDAIWIEAFVIEVVSVDPSVAPAGGQFYGARAVILGAKTEAEAAARSATICRSFGQLCTDIGGASGVCLAPCDDFDNPAALRCIVFTQPGDSICRELAMQRYTSALAACATARDAEIPLQMLLAIAAGIVVCGAAIVLKVTPLSLLFLGACGIALLAVIARIREAKEAAYRQCVDDAKRQLHKDLRACCNE